MRASLVLTILGPDRPGLVDAVADAVARHDGSWQESRMVNLSGQFAGLLHVDYPADQKAALESDLNELKGLGLLVLIAHDTAGPETSGRVVSLDVTGHDEPGIVKRVASALADLNVNVEELETTLESAPMAGHLLFCTRGRVRLPEGLDPTDVIARLEEVGSGLTVDLQ